jgi:alpha-amylase
MFADIDHSHPEVRKELFNWIEWLGTQLQLGGLRLDAIKHYSATFLRDFIHHVDQTVGKDWLIVGEYWKGESNVLAKYIEFMNHRISLFDVRLVYNLSRVSQGHEPDMRKIFEESLVLLKPSNTIVSRSDYITPYAEMLISEMMQTFVANHDTVSCVMNILVRAINDLLTSTRPATGSSPRSEMPL